jgi:parallel beta-helix repeat protein
MATKIQVRRGNEADVPTLSQGEFGLALDTSNLYIGGASANIRVNASSLPTGGTLGQILAKKSPSDFDTEWVDAPEGTGGTGSTVADSTTNGNIVVDSQEVVVYAHPATHPASMITTDSTHRFVSDAQIAQIGTGTPSAIYVNVLDYDVEGNGVHDDTAGFNAAVTYANSKGGGCVVVPDGTYLIDADFNNGKSIQMKSNVTLYMLPGAILKAKTNSISNYAVIRIKDASNVAVIGGTVFGERTTHTGSGGEWGHGISIVQSSDVTLDTVIIKNCWGDGIYITGVTGPSRGIKVRNCIADNNRRQGMSLIYSDGVIVTDSIFRNTNGTPPECGIDLEPNMDTAMYVRDTQIIGCIANNNNGSGFCSAVGAYETVYANCYARGNKQRGFYLGGNSYSSTVTGCNIIDNIGDGIYVNYSPKNIMTDNLIKGNTGYGIYIMNSCPDNTIKGNSILSNGGGGVYIYHGQNAIINGNRIQGNAGTGIITQSTGGVDVIEGNIVSGNSGYGVNVGSTPSVVTGNVITGNTSSELSYSTGAGSVVANNYVV